MDNHTIEVILSVMDDLENTRCDYGVSDLDLKTLYEIRGVLLKLKENKHD